jgi:hypothetical protein
MQAIGDVFRNGSGEAATLRITRSVAPVQAQQ